MNINGVSSYVGGIIGYVWPDPITITNTYSTGMIHTTDGLNVGGLGGRITYSKIVNSYSSVQIQNDYIGSVGGLVGEVKYYSKCINSYATGNVVSAGAAGGLIGYMRDTNELYGCYATGNVTGTYDVGGLIGTTMTHIAKSVYATGTVKGQQNIGGLYGRFWTGYSTCNLENIYSTSQIIGLNGSGSQSIGGLVGKWEGPSVCNIKNAYYGGSFSTGSGYSSYYLGGMIGYINDGINLEPYIQGVFWNSTLNPSYADIGRDKPLSTQRLNVDYSGIESKSSSDMKDINCSIYTGAGWDFVNIWLCDTQTPNYPTLQLPYNYESN